MKFPSSFNCDGKIVNETGPWTRFLSMTEQGLRSEPMREDVTICNISHWLWRQAQSETENWSWSSAYISLVRPSGINPDWISMNIKRTWVMKIQLKDEVLKIVPIYLLPGPMWLFIHSILQNTFHVYMVWIIKITPISSFLWKHS